MSVTDKRFFTVKLENGKFTDYAKEDGVIKDASLGLESDRRFLTVSIGIEFDGSYQAMGGWVLGGEDDIDKPYVVDLKNRIFNLFQVSSFKELIGKKVTAVRKSPAWGEYIAGLVSEDGYAFFIDHWRREHFPDQEEYQKMLLPEKRERPKVVQLTSPRNRLKEVE